MSIQKNLREIILDTETTGLEYENGDRIVDIACVELINHIPTGLTYQTYINPQRKMGEEASSISGITDDFLKDKPLFHEIADDFLGFIKNDKLIIHNAKFDVGFINSELERIDKPTLSLDNAIDTLDMARKKFPGASASLDSLCKRFDIDTSAREKHGALIDCFLIAEVYINLIGGKQSGLTFHKDEKQNIQTQREKKTYHYRIFEASETEISTHKEFIKTINNSIWEEYYT